MGKRIFALVHPELTVLQEEQISLGYQSGLKQSQVRRYAHAYYNFRQMEQIRLALSDPHWTGRISMLCNPKLSAEQMQELRTNAYSRKNEWVHQRNKLFSILLVIGVTFGIVLAQRKTEPLLELTGSTAELYCGETFRPMDYVKSYSEGELILPENVDTKTAGERIVVYELVHGKQRVWRTLLVKVNSLQE